MLETFHASLKITVKFPTSSNTAIRHRLIIRLQYSVQLNTCYILSTLQKHAASEIKHRVCNLQIIVGNQIKVIAILSKTL